MGIRLRYVGRKQQYHTLVQNIGRVAKKYYFSNGYFGKPGTNSRVRLIYSTNPISAAKEFFNLIGEGGVLDLKTLSGGIISWLKEGTAIIYRKTTKSVDSPAIEIRFQKAKQKDGIKQQKIHFIKEK